MTNIDKTIHNPNCDGEYCANETGEVRIHDAENAHLCRFCWDAYNAYAGRQRHMHPQHAHDWPDRDWDAAEIYFGRLSETRSELSRLGYRLMRRRAHEDQFWLMKKMTMGEIETFVKGIGG